MDLTAILANIEHRLRVMGISADEASRRAGRPDAIRNLRRKVRGDLTGGVNMGTMAALAKALDTTVPDLMRSDHPVSLTPVPGLREYLLKQRALIDEQIAALDAAEFTAQRLKKKKVR